MKLIIDIDEKVLEHIKIQEISLSEIDVVCESIANGKPYDERTQGDLISRSYLKNLPFERVIHTDYGETAIPIEEIETAPTVEAPTYTDIIEANKEGYNTARRLYERSQCYCNNCDFRKFTEKFIGGVVELMKENDITSLELLSEMLGKGNDNDG